MPIYLQRRSGQNGIIHLGNSCPVGAGVTTCKPGVAFHENCCRCQVPPNCFCYPIWGPSVRLHMYPGYVYGDCELPFQIFDLRLNLDKGDPQGGQCFYESDTWFIGDLEVYWQVDESTFRLNLIDYLAEMPISSQPLTTCQCSFWDGVGGQYPINLPECDSAIVYLNCSGCLNCATGTNPTYMNLRMEGWLNNTGFGCPGDDCYCELWNGDFVCNTIAPCLFEYRRPAVYNPGGGPDDVDIMQVSYLLSTVQPVLTITVELWAAVDPTNTGNAQIQFIGQYPAGPLIGDPANCNGINYVQCFFSAGDSPYCVIGQAYVTALGPFY